MIAIALIREIDIDDLGAEAVLATESLDLSPHVLDNGDEAERTDVRLSDVKNFLGRAGFHELSEHLATVMARIADAAVQLAVGKRAGAALAKLRVRCGIEHATPPETPCVLRALAHDLAALEDDRTESHLREHKCAHEAARSRTDHDRSLLDTLGGTRDELIGGIRRGLDVTIVFQTREEARFVAHIRIDRVNELDRGFLARIPGAPEYTEAQQIIGFDPEPRHHCLPKIVLRMIKRQPQLGDPQHPLFGGFCRRLRREASPDVIDELGDRRRHASRRRAFLHAEISTPLQPLRRGLGHGRIEAQLTQFTDVSGTPSATKTTSAIYGPYIRKVPPLPVGPSGYKNTNTVLDGSSGNPGASTGGWFYNATSGDIKPNLADSVKDESNKAYNAY